MKVGAIVPAGWHNEITLVLTGLDVERKAELALDALWAAVPGGRDAFERVETRLLRADRADPQRMTEAVALLTIAVAGEKRTVARLSRAAVETALASYPGFFATTPPGPGSAGERVLAGRAPRRRGPAAGVLRGLVVGGPGARPAARRRRP